jgi:hypothetical protein
VCAVESELSHPLFVVVVQDFPHEIRSGASVAACEECRFVTAMMRAAIAARA